MIVGLTGGMGCGKSAAARRFAARGWETIDCDAIAWELLERDPETRAEVAAAFGAEILDAGGGIDRRRLAKAAFGDPAKLAALEGLMHPRVRRRWQAAVRARPQIRWVVEIPLLFEKNLENRVDFTLCVFCDLETQFARLASKGFSRAEARARIERQLPLAEKAERADCVLLNDGVEAALNAQVDRLLPHLSVQPEKP